MVKKVIQELRALSGGLYFTSEKDMQEAVERIELEYPDADSAELNFWLGITFRNFTAWFIRGDERKRYLLKAVGYLEKAYEIEKRRGGDDWVNYASNLGIILIDEKIVRDLEKGIKILEEIYLKTKRYEPSLYYYVDGLYKMGEFEKAAETALEVQNRATESEGWQDIVGPRTLAAKAYRALIKKYKKEGGLSKALEISEKLLDNPAATENDIRVHEKIKRLLEND